MGAAPQEPLRLVERPHRHPACRGCRGGGRVIVNLASKEYWAAVAGKLPAGLRVIEIDFREDGPDGLRFNTFAAKRARGMMARHICEHRIEHPEQLKHFNSDGYTFDPEGSTAERWRFRRS